MKILHSSDWHLGRVLNEKSLIEDQAHGIAEILKIIREQRPDIVLLAGDVYDRFVPSAEALALAEHFIEETVLVEKIPVLLIGGNHDGRKRLSHYSSLLNRSGLYVVGELQKDITPIVLQDQWGDIAFWPVPYIKPAEYLSLMQRPFNSEYTYHAMYADIIADIQTKMDPSQRNVFVTHSLVLSGVEEMANIDDSVRPLQLGGIDYVDAALFSDFDYVALGHLHRPQKVGKETVRYAGSLLKYSFSEHLQKKSITLVTLEEKGQVALDSVDFQPLRDLRILEGYLEDLLKKKNNEDGDEDYLKIILSDEKRQLNPMERLRQIYPNVMELTYREREKQVFTKSHRDIKESLERPDKLYQKFYEQVHGVPLNREEGLEVAEIFKSLESGEV